MLKPELKVSGVTRALIYLFVPVCVLYYFLRFQLSLIGGWVLPIYMFVISVSFVYVLLYSIARSELLFRNALDVVILVFLLHSMLLTIVTYVREPIFESLVYCLKDYVFPPVFYFFCRSSLDLRSSERLIKLLNVVFVIVSAIYILEFVDRILMGGGGFVYTQKINELTMSITKQDSLSTSVVKGDIYTLIRMPGPLSHNNVTGLAMAFGLIISSGLYLWKKRFSNLVISITHIIALILAAPRTAIFSFLIGFAFLLVKGVKSRELNVTSIVKISTLSSIALVAISSTIVDWSAFDKIFNLEKIYNTLVHILTIDHVDMYLSSISVPLTWAGVGFSVPSKSAVDFTPILSDDIFIIQLLSMYGFPFIFLVIAFWLAVGRAQERARLYGDVYSFISLAIIVAAFVSTVHTNAFIRPQLMPIIFLAMSVITVRSQPFRKKRQHA